MKTSDQLLIGTYELGLRTIRLYVRPDGDGGSVKIFPADKGTAKVFIGIDCSWGEAVGILLHELYEVTLIDLNTRYRKTPSFSSESSDFMFLLTHNELGEAHERIGETITEIFPAFAKAYKKLSPYKD